MENQLPLVHLPEKHGLYDPAFEHDRAASASSRTSRASAATRSCIDADEVLRNMDHRGACGCEAEHGRRRRHPHRPAARVSAPSVVQDRPRRRAARRRASSPPASCSCRTIAAERATLQAGRRRDHRRAGPAAGRLATSADANREGRHRPHRPSGRAGDRAALHRRGRRALPATPSSGSSTDPQAGQPPAARRRVARSRPRCSTSARCRPR